MHLNKLIFLEENVSGYGKKDNTPKGHVSITSPGVIKCYVQDLKQQDKDYTMYLISKSANKAIRMGKINNPEMNKQTTWKIDMSNIDNTGIQAKDVDCVALIVEGTNTSNTDTVMLGYTKDKYLPTSMIQHALPKVKPKEKSKESSYKPQHSNETSMPKATTYKEVEKKDKDKYEDKYENKYKDKYQDKYEDKDKYQDKYEDKYKEKDKYTGDNKDKYDDKYDDKCDDKYNDDDKYKDKDRDEEQDKNNEEIGGGLQDTLKDLLGEGIEESEEDKDKENTNEEVSDALKDKLKELLAEDAEEDVEEGEEDKNKESLRDKLRRLINEDKAEANSKESLKVECEGQPKVKAKEDFTDTVEQMDRSNETSDSSPVEQDKSTDNQITDQVKAFVNMSVGMDRSSDGEIVEQLTRALGENEVIQQLMQANKNLKAQLKAVMEDGVESLDCVDTRTVEEAEVEAEGSNQVIGRNPAEAEKVEPSECGDTREGEVVSKVTTDTTAQDATEIPVEVEKVEPSECDGPRVDSTGEVVTKATTETSVEDITKTPVASEKVASAECSDTREGEVASSSECGDTQDGKVAPSECEATRVDSTSEVVTKVTTDTATQAIPQNPVESETVAPSSSVNSIIESALREMTEKISKEVNQAIGMNQPAQVTQDIHTKEQEDINQTMKTTLGAFQKGVQHKKKRSRKPTPRR